MAMAPGPLPPLAVKRTQESKARGGAQQQSQPGLGAAQDPQPRHAAPAAHVNHRSGRAGTRRKKLVSVVLPPPPPDYPHPNPDPKVSARPLCPTTCLSPSLGAGAPPALISESEVSWPPTPAPNPTTLQTTNPPPRLQTPGHPPQRPRKATWPGSRPAQTLTDRSQPSKQPSRPLLTLSMSVTSSSRASRPARCWEGAVSCPLEAPFPPTLCPGGGASRERERGTQEGEGR